MKKSFLYFVLFILLSFNLSAQFYQPLCSKAFEASQRPLLVEIDDFDCLANADSIVKKYWPYNQNISYKTTSEIDLTMQYNPDFKWVIMSAGYRDEMKTIQGKKVAVKVFAVTIHLSEDASFRTGKNVDKKFVFKMDFPYCISGELEMKLFLKQAIQRIDYMKPKEMSSKTMKKYGVPIENAKKASKKTLLIPKETIDMTEAEIAIIYKYPFKIVSRQEINSKIESASPSEMILNVVWSDKKNGWSLMCVDLEDYNVNLSIPLRKLEFKATDRGFSKEKQLAIEKLDVKITDKILKKLNSTLLKLLIPK